MTIFHLGQRVKLVHPYHPENTGHTGRISALFSEIDGATYPVNCDVVWDQLTTGFSSLSHTSRLEPIIPEGMKGCDWSDCLWQPETELVEVSP